MRTRPQFLDVKRIVEDVPPGHWLWLGADLHWARLMVFEKSRGIELDDSFLTKVRATCEVSRCVRPRHLKLHSPIPSEGMLLKGVTLDELDKS